MQIVIKLLTITIGLFLVAGCANPKPSETKSLKMTLPENSSPNPDINIGKIEFVVK